MAREGTELGENDYVIRVLNAPGDVAADPWNALLALEADPSPFMRHAYLCALHESGSASPAAGWRARFVTLWQPVHGGHVGFVAGPPWQPDYYLERRIPAWLAGLA